MKYSDLSEIALSDLALKLKDEYTALQNMQLSLNMARGKPSAAQLDLALGVLETLKARYEFANSKGNDVRNYGIWDGLPEMKQIFADMMDVPPQQIILGNNSSLLIMFDVISRGFTHGFNGCTPWGKQDGLKFLCPVPGYDRHFAITEYFGFEMINIPMDDNGPDMDMVEKLVAEDEKIKGIWCVPKYSNPTGITYSDEVVRRFAALRPAAKDFKIMWDNAYCVHHLTDTPDHLLDIYNVCLANGTEDMLMMFASTSKISFPGAGVACVATSDRNIVDLKKHFMTQTIGPDKMNQLRHVLFLHDIDGVMNLMRGHRDILAPKFKLCQDMLKEKVGELGIAKWNEPNGGYFISVDVMEGCAKRVVQLCKEAGVILTDAGATYPYGNDPKDCNIRLAPSFPPLDELEQAMEVFCTAIKLAAAEKLLSA